MAQRLYKLGNYIIKENAAGDLLRYPTSSFYHERKTGFFTLVDNKNRTDFKIAFANSANWDNSAGGGTAYSEATLRTFFLDNTNFNIAGSSAVSTAFGRAYIEDNTIETVINTIDVFEILAGVFLNGPANNVSFNATGGKLTYDGISNKHFHIVSNLDVRVAANNQTICFQWFKNGVSIPIPVERFVAVGNDIGAMSMHADIDMSTGDFLE